MKTKLFYGLCLLGLGFTGNAQNVSTTAGLTSGGNNAGSVHGYIYSVFYGASAGNAATTSTYYDTFIGHNAGMATTTGTHNTFTGYRSGEANVSGSNNSFYGSSSGRENTGSNNTAIGSSAGIALTSGGSNTFLGYYAGNTTTGNYNTAIGRSAGAGSSGSTYNTSLGYYAGNNSTGSENVFIGANAGRNSTGSDQLFITNAIDTTPLIWGDFAANNLVFNGKVGITEESLANQANLFPDFAGTADVTGYQLFVNGGILTEAVRVQLDIDWADYVFADDYKLLPLEEVESFIEENGHLPNVPSAEEVKSNGIELAEMAKIQQEKIEELTLYLIEQKKEIETLKTQMKAMMEQKQ